MKTNRNNLSGIVVFLVLAALVGGMLMFRKASQSGKADLISTPKPAENLEPSDNEKSDWEAYTNTDYGFSFRYPSYLYDVTSQANTATSNLPGLGVIAAMDKNQTYTVRPLLQINAIESGLSAEEYAKSLPIGDVSENGTVTTEFLSGYQETRQHMSNKTKSVYFSNGRYIVKIALSVSDSVSDNDSEKAYNNSDFLPTFTELYQSFKFE